MWPFSRRRFRDLVARQLSVFAQDHEQLVADARAQLSSYHHAHDPAQAQAHYGDHDELAEQVEELLDEMYRHYAATLDDDGRRAYRREFARQARAGYGDLLPRLTFDSDDDKLPE